MVDGQLALPPLEADGLHLADLQLGTQPAVPSMHGPVVVSRTEDGVIAVNLIDEDAAQRAGFGDVRTLGESGPTVHGRPTRVGATTILQMPRVEVVSA